MNEKREKAQEVKEVWDLSLLYKSQSDPKLVEDILTIEKNCEAFAKKWKPKITKLNSLKTLSEALRDYEELAESNSKKPLFYLSLARSINTEDKTLLASIGKIEERVIRAGNLIEFFTLAIGKLPENLKNKFLKDKKLSRYHHFLDGIFRSSRHQLSESEEKLSNIFSRPGSGMWKDFVDSQVSSLTTKWKGKEMPLEEAALLVTRLKSSKERKELRHQVMEKLKTVSGAAEAELNAVYVWKKSQDELRGYKNPEDGVFEGYEVDKETVETLFSEVEKAYPLVHRYYKAKAKLLKLPKLAMSDLSFDLPPPKGIKEWRPSFKEATETLSEIVGSISPRYSEFLNKMLREGRIDAYPRKHKTGGAFCAPSRKIPTYILLNHDPSAGSFMTLAHEFGHAIHASMHGHQPVFYDGETLMSAEVASTFFERLAADVVLKKIKNYGERLSHLVRRADDFVGAVFRQTAAHYYAKSLHSRIRNEGYLSAPEMASELNKSMSKYLGPAVTLLPEDGYTFVWWGHLRSHFYFAPYVFGELVAVALHRQYKQTGRVESFEKFMSMGASKRVEEIFRDSGLDVRKSEIWKEGLSEFEDVVKELETAVKNKLGSK